MSSDAIIRQLLRSRGAVAVALLAAIVVGLAASYRVMLPPRLESRRAEVGYARAAAIVDTKRSQAVDARAGGGSIAELRNRAVLLADLMTRSPLREEIADRALVPRGELLTRRPMNLLELRLTQKEVSKAVLGEGDPRASVMHVGVHFLVEGKSPIVGVDVRSADPRRAARLADEAIGALEAYVARAPSGAAGPGQRLAVRRLEPASVATVTVGPPPTLALLAAFGTLSAGCALIVAWTGLLSALRSRRPSLRST